MKNLVMTKMTVDQKYYPLFDAYCRAYGILFHLCGGGFKSGFVKNGKDIAWNKGTYVGLPVNVIGLFYDLKKGCHINNIIMRLSLIVMNIYFLTL